MSGSEAVLNAIAALEDCGIPYILVGSFSTNAYGIPRSTEDADFVIELGEASISELGRRLAPSIRIDPQISFETVTMTRRYVAEVVGTPFKIEFFLLGNDPHHQERFRRRQLVTTLGQRVWLPTPEDVIVTKLHWALLGGRSKDRDDARDVIAVQGDKIDWDTSIAGASSTALASCWTRSEPRSRRSEPDRSLRGRPEIDASLAPAPVLSLPTDPRLLAARPSP